MDRWIERQLLWLGIIGHCAAIVVELLKYGVNVVGLARRKEKVEALQQYILSSVSAKLYSIKCDLTQESEIKAAFNWIKNSLAGVDILINNAGIIRTMNLLDLDNSKDLRDTIDTNILAIVI